MAENETRWLFTMIAYDQIDRTRLSQLPFMTMYAHILNLRVKYYIIWLV